MHELRGIKGVYYRAIKLSYINYMKSRHLKNIPQIVKLDRTALLMNRQCLDAFHVRARTRGVTALTAHHPFWMRLGFWLAITPIIMLPMRRRTKSSRTTWMARLLASGSSRREMVAW